MWAPGSEPSGRGQRGFTLIELMVVVAIIAILAFIVVPSFIREGRKTKGGTEVTAMFSELRTKEEAYKSENSAYLAAAQCPSSVSTSTYDFVSTCKTTGSAWESLRVQPTASSLRCAYTINTGAAGVNPSPPSGCTLPTNPSEGWFMITATCEMDGQTGNSQYVTSSLDSTICKINEGK